MGVVAKHIHVTACSIFSVVQYFCPDYELLLELHTLTLAACSYTLLLWHLRNCYCILFWPCFFSSLLCSTIDDSERACDSLWTAPWLADHLRNLHLFFLYHKTDVLPHDVMVMYCGCTHLCLIGFKFLWAYVLKSHKLLEAGHQDSSSAAGGKGSFLTKKREVQQSRLLLQQLRVVGAWLEPRFYTLEGFGLAYRFGNSPILQRCYLLCYLSSFTIYVQQEKLSATTAELRLQRALWLVKPHRKTEFGSHPLKLPAPSWVLLHF